MEKKKDNPQTSISIQVKVTRTRFTFLLKTTSLPKKQNMQIYERTTLKILDIRQQRTVIHEKRENDKVNPLIVPAHCLKFPRREEQLRCRDLGLEKMELRVWGDQGSHRCWTQYRRRESCKEREPRDLQRVTLQYSACKGTTQGWGKKHQKE